MGERIFNDDISDEEFKDFFNKTFQRYSEIMDPKAVIYVFRSSSYQREFEDAMNTVGIIVRTQCIWVKNNFTLSYAHYNYKYEPVFYAHLKGKFPFWFGDLKQNTVWKSGLPIDNPGPETVWEVPKGYISKSVHPTQKPLELLGLFR